MKHKVTCRTKRTSNSTNGSKGKTQEYKKKKEKKTPSEGETFKIKKIPPWAWMSVCCECCLLSDRGLCDGLVPHPEES
jgi:hypothetical protein